LTLQISKRPDLTHRILTGGSNFVKLWGFALYLVKMTLRITWLMNTLNNEVLYKTENTM
jgi:hypothetical protein